VSDQQGENQGSASSGATGAVQEHANQMVELAQGLANDVIDAGEEAVSVVLSAVSRSIHALGDVVDALQEKTTGR
jgi:hypothetical protein